jgi:hypothetical protein
LFHIIVTVVTVRLRATPEDSDGTRWRGQPPVPGDEIPTRSFIQTAPGHPIAHERQETSGRINEVPLTPDEAIAGSRWSVKNDFLPPLQAGDSRRELIVGGPVRAGGGIIGGQAERRTAHIGLQKEALKGDQ